jgi:uncharacterized membrane-anchored protein
VLLILAMLFPSLARGAVVEPEVSERAKAMLAAYSKLVFQQGEIDLRQGLAKLKLTEGFRFLSAKDAKTVLVDFWGNSPDQHPLGMIVPPDTHLLSSGSWAVIINYEDDGHVKDADADSINYSRLLQEMQDGIRKWNATRKQQHFPSIELVGWAIPPHYEKATHKLHWAKELKFEDSEGNTLNYDIRVLGRHGVLSLNTVASMTRLEDVTQRAPRLSTWSSSRRATGTAISTRVPTMWPPTDWQRWSPVALPPRRASSKCSWSACWPPRNW